jgi:hypothetical protein
MREELRSNRGKIISRLAFLAVMVVSLYVLWPSLVAVFSTAPQLLTIEPWWFVVMLGVYLAGPHEHPSRRQGDSAFLQGLSRSRHSLQ